MTLKNLLQNCSLRNPPQKVLSCYQEFWIKSRIHRSYNFIKSICLPEYWVIIVDLHDHSQVSNNDFVNKFQSFWISKIFFHVCFENFSRCVLKFKRCQCCQMLSGFWNWWNECCNLTKKLSDWKNRAKNLLNQNVILNFDFHRL